MSANLQFQNLVAPDYNRPYLGAISCGFPSPAADFSRKRIDIKKILVNFPDNCIVRRINGNDLSDLGISHSDVLIFNKTKFPFLNNIILCIIDGEQTVKRVTNYNELDKVVIHGVLETHIIRAYRTRQLDKYTKSADLLIETDINDELMVNPLAIYYARAKGDCLTDFSINHGDILVINKSLELKNNAIAAITVDKGFTAKRVEIHKEYALLHPANPAFKPIKVDETNEFIIWGMIQDIIKRF
jgi:DNA polymerase V